MPLLTLLFSLLLLAVATIFFILQKESAAEEAAATASAPPLLVFYATLKGRSRRLAKRLVEAASKRGIAAQAVDLAGYDADLLAGVLYAVFVLPTYAKGTAPDGYAGVIEELVETASDFRVSKASLSTMSYSVFGCGNSEYPPRDFNAVARRVDRTLRTLGAVRVTRRCDGDDRDNRLEEQFDEWLLKLLPAMEARQSLGTDAAAAPVANSMTTGHFSPGQPTKGSAQADADNQADDESDCEPGDDVLVDLEDLGGAMKKPRRAGDDAAADDGRKEMVSASLRASLTKQGYKVVGSHSGVKLCRWTKAMLRGRGGCYKHTFYGIASYQCMEATPSLACANKCVFCWRHHDNPVGTSFRWKIDSPQLLLDGFESNHLAMIKQLRGVPGVKPERFEEAVRAVRHCALSLVGEPIIYPQINEFLDLLHARGISSFMVTNAQFPEQMETLRPCTQLYISIDAPTKEQLKAVDRPLFSDFWERFQRCVELLREKQQRTVFRLTLVNEWNTSELGAYADLVKRGQPDFIEVKGVTYCGESKASPLTIKNCPFHEQVRAYCEQLTQQLGGEYELASEHAHSNCVLIAHRRFKLDGVWHTWINYERFTQLYTSGEPFSALDYVAPTPPWGVYDPNAEDGGFDPAETRTAGKGGAKSRERGT